MRLGAKTARRCVLATWFLPAGAAFGQALPSGGSFSAGSGMIFSAGAGAVTVAQSSARGVIDWSGFSIGAGGRVTFNNGAGATLNRVTGDHLSSVAGDLNATGSVFLINPNGVVVAAGGKVITGGDFVASTRDVADGAFMAAGALVFTGGSAGMVANLGEIDSRNGDVVLIGAAAVNNGVMSAPHGTAALAAGDRVLLSDAGGPKGIYVAPDAAATGNVTNSGVIMAAAAALASAGGNVYALAGNQGGLIEASGTDKIAGQVWLTAPAGTVAVSGTVKAAGADGGGTILAKGRAVTLADTAVLDAAGRPGQAAGMVETSAARLALGDARVTAGVGGNWLVDPENLTIGGAAAAAIDSALNAGTNVTEQTTANGVADGSGAATTASGAGDIDVVAPMAWTSGATLTLSAFNDVNIESQVSIAGNGGLAITSGGALRFMNDGAIDYTAGADTNAAPLTINGAAYSLIFSNAQLRAVAANGDYALAQNLNETGVSGFMPVAESTPFTGVFNGLGNSIANLTIDDTADPFVGLFGQIGSGGVVENLGVTGSFTGGDYAYAGGLAGGLEGGTVRNCYTSASVNGGSANGGLAGFANGATIVDSYATGAVGNGAYAGGLVAFAVGGTAQNSYAAGAVSGGADTVAGGLIGYDGGVTVRDSYASGAVTGGADATVGGLAGLAVSGTIEDSYATGAVTGGSNQGGLAGDSSGAAYTDDYYDTTTTGMAAGTGPGTGLSTAQWLSEGPTVAGSAYGFVNQSAWVAGAPYPVLAALPYLAITQSGSQVYGGTASHVISSITDSAGNDASGLVDLSGFSTLTDVSSASDVGAYALGGAGARAPGYQVDYTGSLTVTQAPLTITLGNQTSVYGQTPALVPTDYTASGTLYNGDTLSGVTLATNAASASPVGSGYTVFATGETGTGLGNYNITVNDGGLSVTPAALLITANAQSSVYGQTPALGDTAFSMNGLVTANGDTVSSVALGTDATGASPVGLYMITPAAAVGTGLGNYTITYDTGTLTIAPAALTIMADDQSSTYGQTPGLGDTAFSVSGLVNGDTADSVTLATDASSASPVGLYTISPRAAVGTGLGNYTIAYDTGTLTIAPAALTIMADDQSSTYGQTPGLGDSAFSTSGLVNGDTADSVTLVTDASSASPVGLYTISPRAAVGTGLGNYTIAYDTGTLTIAPAALTITADDVSKDAGAAINLGDTGFTAAGLVNDDSVSAVTLASEGAAAGASVQNSPYAIVPSGAMGTGLSNYTIAYVDGALTVAATVSLSAVAQAAVYLPDGNAIAPVSQLLPAGPSSNAPAALPLIISRADAAGVAVTSGGLAISTGLALAGQGNETSLLGDRGRHLDVSLPPAPAPAAGPPVVGGGL